ncbi:inorganic diphosphatase [Croceitalea sp. MTPC5]|nr:inorganic diphosphatase [Croceitalea sp. MTPC5]
MFYSGGFLSLVNCGIQTNIYNTPTFSPEGKINCIIEIPAGTNKKIEFNRDLEKFQIDTKNGKKRIINFLPYPGNYGFIPSTYSDPKKRGDGDALDVIVLSESLNTGTILEIELIGMIELLDNREYDYKIIAVPREEKLRTIKATSFLELKEDYPGIIDILQIWFLNYDHHDELQIQGWVDETKALQEIRNSLK